MCSWTIEDRKPNGYYKGKSCIKEGCKKKVVAKGMCMKHYQRMRHTGQLDLLPPKPTPNCLVEGCERKHYGRNYCQLHWQHWRKTGDPLQGTREQYLEKIRADAVTCDVVCQGVRCGNKIGRGHGDGINHRGSTSRRYCSPHHKRWLDFGDVKADEPIVIQHPKGTKRPPCKAPDCENEARGWQGTAVYCDTHKQRLEKHGRLHAIKNSNIGKTCSVEWCDKVCKSGEDKFVRGMCAQCASRLNDTGTTDLSHTALKRRGIYRTCAIRGCDENETGETLLCKRHWDQQYRKRTQDYRNARTRIYRAKKQGANSDYHSIAELHQYWRDRGIDPKRCTYCDAWHTKWKNNWKNSVGDHVIAINKGGTDTKNNMVPCCTSCNSSKRDKTLYDEWTPPKDRDNWHGWKAA